MKENIHIKIFKYASNKTSGVTIDEVIDHLNIPKGDQKRNFVINTINKYMDRAEGFRDKFIMRGEAINLLNQHQGLVATKKAFWLAALASIISLIALGITYWGISSDVKSDETWKNNQISKLDETIVELKKIGQNLQDNLETLNMQIDSLNSKSELKE
jgi:hypothetical protein